MKSPMHGEGRMTWSLGALGEDVESCSDVRLTTWARCRTVNKLLISPTLWNSWLPWHVILGMGCRLSGDDQRMSLMRRIFSYFRNPVSLYHGTVIIKMSDYPAKTRYVGRDLEGKLCQFLEIKTDRIHRIFREPFLWVWWYLNGSVSTASPLRFLFTNIVDQRTKRIVQYRDPSDVWNYIGGGKRLPGATSCLHGQRYSCLWYYFQSNGVCGYHTQEKIHLTSKYGFMGPKNTIWCGKHMQELQRDLERQQRVISNAFLIEQRDMEERHERLRLEQSLRKQIAAGTTQIQELQEPSVPSNDSSIHSSKKDGTPLLGQELPPASDEPQSWLPQFQRRG